MAVHVRRVILLSCVWSAMSAVACSRSNNVLLGRVEAIVDGHTVVVTDCYRMSVPLPEKRQDSADGSVTYRFTPCRDADVVMRNGDLVVNDRSYGTLNKDTVVMVHHGQVLLDGRKAQAASGEAREPNVPDAAATRQKVAQAMERYMVAARAVDASAIAAFYTPTATLFEPGIAPIQTRDAIRAFMASFPGVRVEVATATPDSIEVYGGTAYLWGSYFERLAFPGQPVSEQHGRFVTKWVRQTDGTWLIERYFRVPTSSESPSPR